ncbi:transposase [uncultured Culturomica sp.]|uniref:transposase n=1 Tax=uncultured Culturomica sp. TaxID=1926654 RepID=UPI0003368D07|nr:putative uncharacterized protein [Odoribacter sp. CAG:788]
MPRHARQRSITDIYHVMLRGIDRTVIFLENDDRQMFLNLLRQQASPEFKIYCYCLMTNHIHLILESQKLSKYMHHLATGYALWFNHKYARRGYLYQDRFKSEAIENESYLLQCFRYILQNPIKAGVCDNAHEYQWSSYNSYFSSANTFVYTNFLNLFFTTPKDFETYIATECSIKCIDIEDNTKMSYDLIRKIFKHKLKGRKITDLSKTESKQIVKELKKETRASLRLLSLITGMSIGVIRYL